MSRRTSAALLLAIAILLLAGVVAAQVGSGFDLHWNVAAGGGGGRSTGSGWTVDGSAGQTAADLSTGTVFRVFGGFWQPFEHSIYLPLIRRS